MAEFGSYYNEEITPASTDIILIADASNINNVEGVLAEDLPINAATQTALNEKIVASDVEQRTYGANLRRFKKKARDWRSGRRFAIAPKIVLIGDSICGGSWAEDFKTWLCNAFNIPYKNFGIHWYGGYAIEHMISFIEDIAIFPNPDLILFAEYGTISATDQRLMSIENIITLMRNKTTADIGILTWSMSATIAENYIADSTTLIDDDQYQTFNWYRDIAAIYQCELIDFNEAMKNAFDAGYSVSDLGMSGPHLSTAGYTLVHLPEIKKHFSLSDDQLAQNIPYPLTEKEEILYLSNAEKMELFSYSDKLSLTGTWTTDNVSLESTDVGATIEIAMNNIIGFEILHGDDAGASIELKTVGGSYASPSTFQLNNRPLQYISEITSVTYASWDDWAYKRPFKKGIITINELGDTTLISGRYTIKVNSVVEETVTCEMFDPDAVSLGTFIVGQSATFTTGNLSFPQKYNGEDNYQTETVFVVDDLYEFYIHNNWCNTLKAAKGKNITDETAVTIYNILPNIAEFANGIFHYKYVEGTPLENKPYMSWNNDTGIVAGHVYEIIYEELSREGTGILWVANSFATNASYITHQWTATSPLSYLRCERLSGTTDFDITFRLSVRDITANQEYESTKKVFGLERDDYVLKMAVASATNLFAIRMLH